MLKRLAWHEKKYTCITKDEYFIVGSGCYVVALFDHVWTLNTGELIIDKRIDSIIVPIVNINAHFVDTSTREKTFKASVNHFSLSFKQERQKNVNDIEKRWLRPWSLKSRMN